LTIYRTPSYSSDKTSPPETVRPTPGGLPAGSDLAARRRQRGRRAISALVTAGLLLLLVGVLVYLVVLAQPFADASGGCGGA